MNPAARPAVLPRLPAQVPRLVVAAEMWQGSAGAALAQGFRECGWLVQTVDLVSFLAAPSPDFASRAINRLRQGKLIAAYNAAILNTVALSGADAVLVVKGSYVRAATLDRLKERGVATVNFYPDVHFDHPGFAEDLLAHYALVATTKDFHLERLTTLLGPERVRFVDHGYDPLIHRPVDPAQPQWDIAFVGNHSPHKQVFLEYLASRLDGWSLAVLGNRWAAAAKGGPLAPHVIPHAPTGDLYAAALGAARIAIAIHHGPTGPHGWEDSVSTRTFEIPACGGFMLHIDNPQVRALYDVGAEIDVFASPDDLVGKARHYLERPEQRLAMAAMARARAVPGYSYWNRAATIAAAIGEISPRLAAARSAPCSSTGTVSGPHP